MIRRRVLAAAAVVAAGLAVALWAAPPPAPAQGGAGPGASAEVQAGKALFAVACASCHGDDARGLPGQGPSLIGAGAASADFYLRTGRMPLADPRQEPVRADPIYSDREIRALVAFVASLGPGPAIPAVDPARGDLGHGRELFTAHCAGCHQILARGGILPGAIAPDLTQATPVQIGEALRVGPYVMPRFSPAILPAGDLNSVARYVLWTREPPDRGGWSLGNVGPIPEGMVAWLLAGVALVLVARLIGERGP